MEKVEVRKPNFLQKNSFFYTVLSNKINHLLIKIKIKKNWQDFYNETYQDTKFKELMDDWDAQEYARNREEAYPSTGDQLDYIYHNGVAKWKTDMIDPVKTKYPKG